MGKPRYVMLQMEKDMTNYLQYKMGFSKRKLLVNDTLPSRFDCQQDRQKRLNDSSTSRAAFVKRQKIDLIQECEQECTPKDESVLLQKTLELVSDGK